MKNNNKVSIAISTEYAINKQETIYPMETVGFKNILADDIEDELKATPHKWDDFLNFTSFEHNLKCMFTPFGFFGIAKDRDRAKEILINSIKYN